MAQYARDGGGQQGLHFASVDQPDWFPASNSYGSPADPLNQQQAILTQNDNALMNDFFNNPDAATVNESLLPFNWSGMDDKMSGGDFGGQFEGFDTDSQTIHNPAMSLGGTSSTNYQTHSNSSHHHVPPTTPGTEFLPNRHGQASDDDDVKAASGLYSMFMDSQDGSRGASTFDITASGASWGNFGTNNPLMHMQEPLRSPLTSSGRQSANSYHSQSHNSAQPRQQYSNGQVHSQAQIMQNYLWQQQMAQQMANAPRARHASLQVDTSDFNLFPQQAQTRMPHSAHLPGQPAIRPPAVRFGSDSNFSSYGYRGPSSGIPLEHEKGANLNNVPFAAQAAANGQSHMPPFTPVGPNRAYSHYSMPSGPNVYNNTSTNSSPNNLGGLPMTSMMPNSRIHAHPLPHKVYPAAEDDDEDASSDEVDFEESQPRKRRKSQMELDDDAEYNPFSSHVKPSVSKRGSKASKALALDGSDDDDDYQEITPSTTRASVKRRKSSTNARPSLGSSQSESPSAMTSPPGKSASGGKKKSRANNPRQNLTEDEKRRNHIASEKTRRDLIKVQYDQLDSLVPALKGGKSGLSRSDVLKEIVGYVESVVEANKKIEGRLGNVAAGASAGGYG